ncbi:MAG: bifunctional homocysteine S-methyltransferase/methylenetetrahydrofolate reductase [Chloroflexi bacterium]|nr:bifunctional homocysteine S-methyltransferase/methylenetetrahydrofolate reductase [Chloroflexota bacterium]
MAEYKLFDWLNGEKPILSDGATGTLLHDHGISFEKCFDELNLTNPAIVAQIHKAYIDAGSQIILTNTFGANRYKLGRHGLADSIREINSAAVDLARRVVAASFKQVLIAGDIGPLGVRLAPFGRVQPEEARKVFKEQISILLDSKVDLLVIETVTDLFEVREAIYAAREISSDIPIVASMTFTRDDRTLLGDNPRKVALSMREFGANIIGVNCSGGPNQLLRILKEMHGAVAKGKFWVKPNAGWPEQVGGRIFYPASAEYFGDYALAFWKGGADIIGGCCGTTPDHIAAMKSAIEKSPSMESTIHFEEIESPEIEASESFKPTRMASKLSRGKFVFAVEMDPPRGLSTHKLMAGASLMAEAGADVIDVADSPMARMRMSPWAVCDLIQRKVKVETVLHFPTRGRNLLRVQGDLLAAHALDVRNVFVIMGDPTAIGDYPNAMDNYDLAPSGLVKLIKQGFNAGVDHSGTDIGQPTSFFVGTALNLTAPDMAREIRLMQKKIENGADFVLTQPIYFTQPLEDFLAQYESTFGKFPLPILAGVLPLASSRHAAFLQQEVPGITIPDSIHKRMQSADDNGAREGIRLAVELIGQLKSLSGGVYLMPAFNRFDYAAEIIEASK